MGFSRRFLNRPDDQSTTANTVVVRVVLRSFTTASQTLSEAASVVYPGESSASVRPVCAKFDDAVSVGALAAGAPAP